MAEKQSDTTKRPEKLSKYELMVIIKPHLAEDVRTNIQKQLVADVEKAGGEVKETDVWGKKHLAYEIESFNEGYYVVYKLTLNAAKISDLEMKLKMNQEILRHLLIKE